MSKHKYGNSNAEYAKHLRPYGKRLHNKQSRSLGRYETRQESRNMCYETDHVPQYDYDNVEARLDKIRKTYDRYR